MVKRHKRRKFSGRVCEQIVYTVAGGTDPKTSRPKKPVSYTHLTLPTTILV